MTASDDRILEMLAESGMAHNLRGITNNINNSGDTISYATVKRRIPRLNEAGLVEEIPGQGSYYEITERGHAYLRGDINAAKA